MKLELPERVKFIISTLMNAGFEAYAVGGCVRDLLLGRQPNDWDITTSAKPQDVKKLFRRTIDTGISHGTVTVMYNSTGYEITTYRIDGEYEDSRHPKEVTFTSDLVEDLKRRDFTINAMAYNDTAGLVDEFGGTADLDRKIIRAVGVPEERFSEDALRILRAFRFAAQLGFTIDGATLSAAELLAQNLKNISAERIQTEFTKLLVSDHPEELRDMYASGVTKVIMPEFDTCMETAQRNKHHLYTVGEHTVRALIINSGYTGDEYDDERIKKYVRYALLFHDFGKPLSITTDSEGFDHFNGHAEISERLARDIMKRLKMDNDTLDTVCALVRYHDYRPEAEKKYVRRMINRTGEYIFRMLFPIRIADTLAQSMYKRRQKLDYEQRMMELYIEIRHSDECVSLKDLAVSGGDLIAAGMKPGKEIGEALSRLLDIVLEDPECNTKEYLLSKLH